MTKADKDALAWLREFGPTSMMRSGPRRKVDRGSLFRRGLIETAGRWKGPFCAVKYRISAVGREALGR